MFVYPEILKIRIYSRNLLYVYMEPSYPARTDKNSALPVYSPDRVTRLQINRPLIVQTTFSSVAKNNHEQQHIFVNDQEDIVIEYSG